MFKKRISQNVLTNNRLSELKWHCSEIKQICLILVASFGKKMYYTYLLRLSHLQKGFYLDYSF